MPAERKGATHPAHIAAGMRAHHKVLPHSAQSALKVAAAADFGVDVGDSPERRHAVDAAIAQIKQEFPGLFHPDPKKVPA